jgi:hypothetical protein
MYHLFRFISRLALVLAALDIAFIVGYILWLIWGFTTQTGFYAPLKMKDISNFCAYFVAFMAAYVVAGAMAEKRK